MVKNAKKLLCVRHYSPCGQWNGQNFKNPAIRPAYSLIKSTSLSVTLIRPIRVELILSK